MNDHDLAQAKRFMGEFETIERLAEQDLQPANEMDTAMIVERMLSRYHPQDDIKAIIKSQMDEWLDDLEGWPVDLIELAYRNWRINPKTQFAPRDAGSLMASVQDILKTRRDILSRAQQIPQIVTRMIADEFDPSTRVTAEEIAKINVKLKPIPPRAHRPSPKAKQLRALARDMKVEPQQLVLTHKERMVAVSLGAFFKGLAAYKADMSAKLLSDGGE